MVGGSRTGAPTPKRERNQERGHAESEARWEERQNGEKKQDQRKRVADGGAGGERCAQWLLVRVREWDEIERVEEREANLRRRE